MLEYCVDNHIIEFTTHDLEQTKDVAAHLANVLRKNDILTLDGDLGAGKTSFAQGLCKALNVTDYVTSPTFTIMNVYEGDFTINHFDVYRISDIDELYNIGFDEALTDGGVSLIEWAKLIDEIIPETAINIDLKTISENERKISIKFKDDRILKLVDNIR